MAHLENPPGAKPRDRLGSGFRMILRRSGRPVLAVPWAATRMERPLLAYDGSSKANEALFLATYLSGGWEVPLTLVSISENNNEEPGALQEARNYLLEHGVDATYVAQTGPVVEAIMEIASAHQCDFLIMGGYSTRPAVEIVVGSTVDQMPHESWLPMLICR